MEKLHVTLEQHLCLVCTKSFDTNALLLNRRLKPVFERTTVTGWGLCPECKQRFDDGYIALVGCDESKTEKNPNGTIEPGEAYRTGNIVHLRFEVYDRIINVPRGDRPVLFCDDAVIEKLKSMASQGESA